MVSNTGQCSCEGNNPNCFRCSGTGMVQSQNTNLPQSETYVIGQLLSSLPIKPKIIFPESLVRQKNVNKPAIKVERSPKKTKKILKPATKSPYKNVKNFRASEVHLKLKNMECPICCTYITKTHSSFLNHLKTHDTADNIKHKSLIDMAFLSISETQSDIHLTPPRTNVLSNNNASSPESGLHKMQKSRKKSLTRASQKTPRTGNVILIQPDVKRTMPAAAKSKLVLISKRSKRLNLDVKCAKCGVTHNPVWEYAESNWGKVVICSYCKPAKVFVRFASGSFESGGRQK